MNILEQLIAKKESGQHLVLNHYFRELTRREVNLGHDENWLEEEGEEAVYALSLDEKLIGVFEEFQITCQLPPSVQKTDNDFAVDESANAILSCDGYHYSVPMWEGNLEIPGIGAATSVWIDFDQIERIR